MIDQVHCKKCNLFARMEKRMYWYYVLKEYNINTQIKKNKKTTLEICICNILFNLHVHHTDTSICVLQHFILKYQWDKKWPPSLPKYITNKTFYGILVWIIKKQKKTNPSTHAIFLSIGLTVHVSDCVTSKNNMRSVR